MTITEWHDGEDSYEDMLEVFFYYLEDWYNEA